MLTNFPIIDYWQKPRNLIDLAKRNSINFNKLGHVIFMRATTNSLPQTKQLEKNQKISSSLIIKPNLFYKNHPSHSSPQIIRTDKKKSFKINSNSRKSKQSLNKVFNRTKTDLDHNFVGDKYIKKIKQQIRYHGFDLRPQQGKKQCSFFSKQNRIQIKPNYSKQSATINLSQEQLQRIKQIRLKRKMKNSRNSYNLSLAISRSKQDKQRIRKENECQLFIQKFGPLQPWGNSPSHLSSLQKP